MQDAPITELEARLSELSQERDHFRKLYLETLERCALLERGIIAGNKAERFTADGSQLTLGVLSLLLTPEEPEAAPEAPPVAFAAGTAREDDLTGERFSLFTQPKNQLRH